MRLRRTLAALAATSLFFAACGGDDDNDLSEQVEAEANTDDTAAPADDTQDAVDDAQDALDDLDSLPGDLGDLGDLGEGLEGLDDFMDSDCLEFSLAYSTMFLGGLGLFGGDPEAVEQAQDDLAEIEASVPDEIADEFAIVSEAYGEFYEAMGDSTLSEMGDIDDPMSDPEVEEASDAINTWLEEECSQFSE